MGDYGWRDRIKDWLWYDTLEKIKDAVRGTAFGKAVGAAVIAIVGAACARILHDPMLFAGFTGALIASLIILGPAVFVAMRKARSRREDAPLPTVSHFTDAETLAAEWSPLTDEQRARLIESFRRKLPGKEIQIVHNGMSDAKRFAIQFAAVLERSGVKLVAPPAADKNVIPPGVWICAAGGYTDEIGALLAIAMRGVKLCDPDIVAPIHPWVCLRIGQKTSKHFPWKR